VNSLYQDLTGPQTIFGQFNSFMSNPALFLMQKRNIQLPEDCKDDPEKAVNYLVSSGKMSQSAYNNCRSTAMQMGCRF